MIQKVRAFVSLRVQYGKAVASEDPKRKSKHTTSTPRDKDTLV